MKESLEWAGAAVGWVETDGNEYATLGAAQRAHKSALASIRMDCPMATTVGILAEDENGTPWIVEETEVEQ